jgi:zinc/manganese transport system substrate-binding protein
MSRRNALLSASVVVVLAGAAGCSTSSAKNTPTAATTVNVVAAENFWGSIASQLGGTKANVTTIINSPDTDPHDYEPTSNDARAMQFAQVVIVNGVGYDSWAPKLLAAAPSANRAVITVGDLVGAHAGDNPHRWYNPADVHTVIAAIVTELKKADPKDAAYFTAQQQTFETVNLAKYNGLIADIKAKYAGTPVGASESIFAMLSPALGLDLLTPPTFLRAISEGTDPTAADKQAIDAQIKNHAIKVYVYNSQNATPDVQTQVNAAKAAGIPVTTITETLVPATATFQDWQVAQLQSLEDALAKATGR